MKRSLLYLSALVLLSLLPAGLVAAPALYAGSSPEQPRVAFSEQPRAAIPRATLPVALRPQLPRRGIYAAGGGITSSSWRIVVDLATGELSSGENRATHSASTGDMPDLQRVRLPAEVLTELVARADKTWRTAPAPALNVADYSEVLVVADGEEVFLLEGFGPIQGQEGQSLIRRLQELSPQESRIARLALSDVQGLHGGRNLYVDGNGDAVLQQVSVRMREKRYRRTLPAAELAELYALIGKHRFFAIRIPQRLGIPDEALPTITITLAAGQQLSIAKWDTDRHPDFDAIYSRLLAIGKSVAKANVPIHRGAFDGEWRPKGF